MEAKHPNSAPKPVVFLAFSNGQDVYLANLKEEAKALYDLFLPLQDAGFYQIHRDESTTLDSLFNGFRQFRNRISLFHFGGHADSGHLYLEDLNANSEGLTRLLGYEKDNLKLVFLNGCSTKDHVASLLDKGVPAVISTSVAINDQSAVEFAKQFYKELVNGSTLGAAFDIASAYLISKYDDKERPVVVTRQTRGLELEEDVFPWGLYIAHDKPDIRNWRLVEQENLNINYSTLEVPVIVKSRQESNQSFEVNQSLIDPLVNAIESWYPNAEINKNNFAESNALPLPIMLELRKLLESNSSLLHHKFSLERLKQILLTYQEATRFLAYVSMAQLMQVVYEKQVHLSTSNVLLTRLLSLDRNHSYSFDYFQLAQDADTIIRDHEIEPKLKELENTFHDFEIKEELEGVRDFMLKLLPLLVAPNPSEEIENLEQLCQQAEYCLGQLLEETSFLVRYQLVDTNSGIYLTPKPLPEATVQKIESLNDGLNLSHFFQNFFISEKSAQHTLIYLYRTQHELSSRIAGGDDVSSNGIDESEIYSFNPPEGLFNLNSLLDIVKFQAPQKRFRYANYNADTPNGEDHLDIMPDVRAFANLIASRDLRPPLSIGLFGDWGSGKSFFLTKLRQEVEEYEKLAKRELAKAADDFLVDFKNTKDAQERQHKVIKLFPGPESQVPQVQEWIKRWEQRRDLHAYQCLTRIFGTQLEQLGELRTSETKLIQKLIASQEQEGKKLAEAVYSQQNEAVSLLRTLVELNSENILGYCRNIAQIEFNAWHYIDANLWASMVTNILEDLNSYVGNLQLEEKQQIQIFRDLATTQAMRAEVQSRIDSIETEIKQISDNISQLETAKEKAEDELSKIRIQDTFKLLEKDKNVKPLIDIIREKGNDAYKAIGLDKFDVELDNAEQQVQTLEKNVRSTWTRLKTLWLAFYNLKPWVKTLFLILLLVPILAFWVLPLVEGNLPVIDILAKWVREKINGFIKIGITACVLITEASVIGQKFLKRINEALSAVDVAKNQLQTLKDLASEAQKRKIAEQREVLIRKQDELEKAQQEKQEQEKQVTNLKEELKNIEAGKRLSAFIEKRLLSNDYQRHLGLISMIRQDFEQLTTYLHDSSFYAKVVARINAVQDANNKQNADGFHLEKINTIDRIVLFIDDLDRCPPDKVVQVLQAIHLILAFPLFVVVVGVDVRWISKALTKEYGTMLELPSEELDTTQREITSKQTQTTFRTNATPFDYLEKVFQIPFQLQDMSNGAKEYFIGKLLETDMLNAQTKSTNIVNTVPAEKAVTPSGAPMQLPAGNGQSDHGSQKPGSDETSVTTGIKETPLDAANIPTKIVEPNQQRLERVAFSAREIEFIKAISPVLDGSPRTIKRFINVCRLIKSHAVWGKPQHVHNDKISEYETMILILAMVTGVPTVTKYLYQHMELLPAKDVSTFKSLEESAFEELSDPTKVNQAILVGNTHYDAKALIDEWEHFKHILNLNNIKRGIPLPESTHSLIQDFCNKEVTKIKPLFNTAVRFSFRFTEY